MKGVNVYTTYLYYSLEIQGFTEEKNEFFLIHRYQPTLEVENMGKG